jgi:hypothetical protein
VSNVQDERACQQLRTVPGSKCWELQRTAFVALETLIVDFAAISEDDCFGQNAMPLKMSGARGKVYAWECSGSCTVTQYVHVPSNLPAGA